MVKLRARRRSDGSARARPSAPAATRTSRDVCRVVAIERMADLKQAARVYGLVFPVTRRPLGPTCAHQPLQDLREIVVAVRLGQAFEACRAQRAGLLDHLVIAGDEQ